MTTTYSRVEYPDLNGDVGSFVIPFQFFRAEDLEVSIDGSILDGSTFNISGGNIEFLAGFYPVGRLVLRRITDLTEPEARFSGSSQIRSQDLNAAMDQAFFAIQEVVDGFQGLGITFTADGDFLLPQSSVGLGSVDNTSDADKPISTAQQAAFDLKLDASEFDPANIFGIVANASSGDPAVLDADTLSGASLSSVLDWRNFTNKPSQFPPTSHTHNANQITVGVFPPNVIPAAGVTQYQASLQIDYTQLRNVPPGSLGEIASNDGKLYLRHYGYWVEFDPEENEILSGLGISLSDILGD